MTFKDAVYGLYTKNIWEPSEKINCNHCGSVEYPKISLNTGNNAIKAECKSCGSYIKFLPQSDIILVKRGKKDEA